MSNLVNNNNSILVSTYACKITILIYDVCIMESSLPDVVWLCVPSFRDDVAIT